MANVRKGGSQETGGTDESAGWIGFWFIPFMAKVFTGAATSNSKLDFRSSCALHRAIIFALN